MKNNNRLVILFVASLLFFCFVSIAAAKSAQEVFTFDPQSHDWFLSSGEKAEAGVRGGNIDNNMWFYAVNPRNDAAAKDLLPSILVYNGNTRQYTVVPVDIAETMGVSSVCFSPNGERMVVTLGMSRFFSRMLVYKLESQHLENTFDMTYDDIFFIGDVRFAFTLLDEKFDRPLEGGMWGASAVLYDPAHDQGYVVLEEATATKNCVVMGLTEFADQVMIVVSETSVPTPEDWEDWDKHQETKVVVDLPAAG